MLKMMNPAAGRSIAAGVLALGVFALPGCDSPSGSDGGQPRVPATIAVIAGDAQSDTSGALLPQPVVVEVKDAEGRPVKNAPVAFQVTSGGGSVDPASAVTGTDGRAATRWTLGKVAADSQRLAASTTGAGGATLVARASATPVPGSTVLDISGSGQVAAPGQTLPDSLLVAVNRNGVRVPGVTVVWSTDPGSGTVSPAQAVTNANGYVRAAWTLGGAAGDQHAYATVGGQRVTFTAGPFDVSMLSPYPDATAGDTAMYYVVVKSAFQVKSVTAEVEGRSVQLDFSNGVSWTGSLPLVGLAQGPKTTTLTVTDVAGHVVVRQYHFFYDRPPQLTVISPQANDVALGGTHVQASCADDFGGPCTVRVYTASGGSSEDPTQLAAQGEGSLDATVPLTFQAGKKSYLRVEAVDALGARTARTFPLFWEDAAASLTQAAAFGSSMLDIDGTRLLYVDSTAAGVALRVRNRSSGAEQAVPLPAGKTLYDAGLTAYGVAFTVSEGGLYDWRGGTSALVAVNGVRCQFLPHYVGCINGDYYDLAAHELRGFGGTGLDVADNGDAVWSAAGGVWRFRGGTQSLLANPGKAPRTDGVNVLFDDPFNHLYRYDPAGNELLATTSRVDYDAENGWIAYPVPIALLQGPHQIFTRSPAGVTRQATLFSGGATLQSLGPSGQVVFTVPSTADSNLLPLYAAGVPYTSPVAAGYVFAGLAYNQPQPRIRWVGDELYLLLGRAALRVAY